MDQGKRIRELDSVIIDGLVVSILFAHEEKAQGRWKGGRTNELLLESLFDSILHELALRD